MNSALLTLAEHSGFTQTGRIDEVDRLCAAMAAAWPDAVKAFEYGQSAEGRPDGSRVRRPGDALFDLALCASK